MASSDLFSVYSEDFNDDMLESWKKLQSDKRFCDMSLACGDREVRVHKAIVSYSSPVIRNILKENLKENPLIFISGVNYGDLQNLIDFMYQGEINVEEESLDSFLSLVEDLDLKGLDILKKPIEAESQHSVNQDSKRIKSTINSTSTVSEKNTSPFKSENEDNSKIRFDGIEIEEQNYLEFKQKEESKNRQHESIKSEYSKKYEQKGKNLNKNQEIKEKKGYEPYYQCDKCSKQIKGIHKLKSHNEEIHEGKRYPCEECDFKGTRPSKLKNHIEIEHKGLRFNCSNCAYEAKSMQTLNRHVSSVHQDKRFTCDKCPFQATQIHLLKKHSEMTH